MHALINIDVNNFLLQLDPETEMLSLRDRSREPTRTNLSCVATLCHTSQGESCTNCTWAIAHVGASRMQQTDRGLRILLRLRTLLEQTRIGRARVDPKSRELCCQWDDVNPPRDIYGSSLRRPFACLSDNRWAVDFARTWLGLTESGRIARRARRNITNALTDAEHRTLKLVADARFPIDLTWRECCRRASRDIESDEFADEALANVLRTRTGLGFHEAQYWIRSSDPFAFTEYAIETRAMPREFCICRTFFMN